MTNSCAHCGLTSDIPKCQIKCARAEREIERLKKREKDLMDVIDSRDRALGFVPLDDALHPGPSISKAFANSPRRVSHEPSEPRTDHAENLAKALEHYLKAHDTLSAVQDTDEVSGTNEASDCGLHDTANDAWRAMRTALYEYRKHGRKAAVSLPACECLLRDKAPSAYHAPKCPAYVADLL